MLTEINARKGGREMTIDEVPMPPALAFFVMRFDLCRFLPSRFSHSLVFLSPSSGHGCVSRICQKDQPGHCRQQVVFIVGVPFLMAGEK